MVDYDGCLFIGADVKEKKEPSRVQARPRNQIEAERKVSRGDIPYRIYMYDGPLTFRPFANLKM